LASLDLNVEGLDGARRPVSLRDPVVVVAGFTARDAADAERHIDELAAIGVPRPPTIPVFYPVSNQLLAVPGGPIQVHGTQTSGEVEPVLVEIPGSGPLVTVGSDVTDRDLERRSIGLAKQICPKVVADVAWEFDEVAPIWDELRIESHVDDGQTLYQGERVALIRDPLELLQGAREVVGQEDRPIVVFLGTVPLRTPDFSFGERFLATLIDDRNGRRLECSYEVEAVDGARRGPRAERDQGVS